MNLPNDRMYASTHEWVRIENGTAEIGLTEHAVTELGDIVFINIPSEGDEVVTDGVFGDVESVKAVSDLYSPVSGKIAEVNTALLDLPEELNRAPYEAWIIRVQDVRDARDLMNATQYATFLEEGNA